METKETFEEALARFVTTVQAMINEHHSAPHLKPHTIAVDPGGIKYVRIVTERYSNPDSRSAYCFIDKATGDVLKAASWKTPAKGVRGSIYAKDISGFGVNVYGAEYFR